jgi:hypothetical protein
MKVLIREVKTNHDFATLGGYAGKLACRGFELANDASQAMLPAFWSLQRLFLIRFE